MFINSGHLRTTLVVTPKEEFIADATSGKAKWKALEFANAISRLTLTGELESDGKVPPVGIGVLMVWQKQENAWKLLAREGFKTET